MSKSTVIILEKDDWTDLQKMFAAELDGWPMSNGIKASNDGGKTWTHTYTRTELGPREMKVLRDDVGKAVEGVTKAQSDKLRLAENRDRRDKTQIKLDGNKRKHVVDVLAAKGLVDWTDPQALQPGKVAPKPRLK